MRAGLAGVLIFAAGAAGSAGIYVWQTPKPERIQVILDDAPSADTVSLALPGTASPARSAGPEAVARPTVIPAAPADTDSVRPATPTRPIPTAPMVTAADSARAIKQVGRILTSMKPTEAARIIEHMSDAQVEEIVRGLPAKQTAALLAKLPVERAAALSRRLLAPPATEMP